MNNQLSQAAEERYGIKTDSDDVQKLEAYIQKTYGSESPEILEKVFSSGEAAGFLTVSETYFFREPVHFAFLRDLLPSFEKTGIQICSAAVATGCEAYSIAMLIEAYNRGVEKPIPYHIDAFDINPRVIEIACQGVYSDRTLREDGSFFHPMTAPYLKKTEASAETGKNRVEDALKQNIRFFVHNLMNELPPETYDIIFFRNAFIYFSPRNRERILSNLSTALKRGGILIVGVSETAGVRHADLDEKNRELAAGAAGRGPLPAEVFYFQKPICKRGIVL